MNQLFELVPLIGFFAAYKLYDIYIAVIVLMALMALGLIITKLQKKPITSMQWVSFVLVLVFGGISVFFRNEIFIKWKPTVLNWGFAVAFLLSQYIGKKNFTERLLTAAKIEAPGHIWRRLNWAWVIFFIVSGALNIFVAYQFSTDIWVNLSSLVFSVLLCYLLLVRLCI